MSYRRVNFAPGEWYHCYSKSIDGNDVFESAADYERFMQSLYLSNSSVSLSRDNFRHMSHAEILRLPRKDAIVSIGAWCLMPNHFHILLRENTVGGITKFMHKVGTGFSTYFNIKKKHIGNVFVKPFRSKHIDDDRYLKRVAQYIHLNPAEIFEPGWKSGNVRDMAQLEKNLREYRFGSLADHFGRTRAEQSILDIEVLSLIQDADAPKLVDILTETAAYYANLYPLAKASGNQRQRL